MTRLSERALVLVTTHDVELQALLSDRFELFHFREDPDIESMFDYRLRPGATTARNAIRLLERFGFPAPIVASALRYAGELDAGAEAGLGSVPGTIFDPSRSRDAAARERDGTPASG